MQITDRDGVPLNIGDEVEVVGGKVKAILVTTEGVGVTLDFGAAKVRKNDHGLIVRNAAVRRLAPSVVESAEPAEESHGQSATFLPFCVRTSPGPSELPFFDVCEVKCPGPAWQERRVWTFHDRQVAERIASELNAAALGRAA